MKRYLRLYAYFLRFSFSKAMAFRMDFFFRVIMDTLFYAVQFAFFHIIYQYTPVLGGFSIEQMRIFITAYLFVDALYMTIFSSNCWWLPIKINKGELDYYLTKPISTLFFVSLKDFAANSFLNLVIAGSLLTWAIGVYPLELSTIKIVGFIFLLLNGCILYYFLNLSFLLVVFWTQSPRGFGDLFFSVSHIMERPHRIYQGPIKLVFMTILPFALIASFPATFLFSDDWKIYFFAPLLASLILYFIILGIWSLGIKRYSSASS